MKKTTSARKDVRACPEMGSQGFEPELITGKKEEDTVTIIAQSEAMKRVMERARKFAGTDPEFHALLTGPTGSGKTLLARAIHNMSGRKGSFVELNIAAYPDGLVESELFGYEKGAFTDARKTKPGRFTQADGGTLFLDEIGNLSLQTQAKILHVLERKRIVKLGGTEEQEIDIQLITATNVDLTQAVREGTFRTDLYFRLNGITIYLLPLAHRHRQADIIPLTLFFIAQHCYRHNISETPNLQESARSFLLRHCWEGNIRELQALVRRVMFLERGKRSFSDRDLERYLDPLYFAKPSRGRDSRQNGDASEQSTGAVFPASDETIKETKRQAGILALPPEIIRMNGRKVLATEQHITETTDSFTYQLTQTFEPFKDGTDPN